MATTEQLRAYFTALPAGSEYDRFNHSNIPSKEVFEDLFASVFFKQELDSDSATTDQIGFVQLADNGDVIERISAIVVPFTVVQPHQLPLMFNPNTGVELVFDGGPIDYNGLTYEVRSNIAGTRLSFQIEFTPGTLDEETIVAEDYIVMVDAVDGLPKKALASGLLAETYWERNLGILEPINDNDPVDIGTGSFFCGGIILDGTSNRAIIQGDGGANGHSLYISSGYGVLTGGDLFVYAGYASDGSGVGGDLFLHGGAGTAEGNTYACWEGSTKTGKMAVGGTVTSAQMAIYGKLEIVSGGLEINGAETNAIVSFIGLDSNNIVQERTSLQFHEDLFSTVNDGNILYGDGGEYISLAPGAEGSMLIMGTAFPKWLAPAGMPGLVLAMGATAPEWSALTDTGYCGIDGGTPNFLDSVLVEAANSGIELFPNTDTLDISLDIYSLATITKLPKTSYVAVTGASNVTKKITVDKLISGSGSGNGSGYIELEAGTDFNNDIALTNTITTANLTDYIESGMPLKFWCTGDSAYRYALVNSISANTITIVGDPLVVGTNTLEELYYGGKDKVFTRKYVVDVVAYNSATTTTLLEDKLNMKSGDVWVDATAKLVNFGVIHMTDDTGGVGNQPNVNIRIGQLAGLMPVSTSNSDEGIEVGETINYTGVDIDYLNNTLEYKYNIEIDVTDHGNQDATYLTVFATFIKI